MENLQTELNWFDANYNEKLNDLFTLLKIPSVSTDPEKKADIQAACDYLAEYLKGLGADKVQTFKTKVHPILYAEFIKAGPSAKTLLIYSHYDVQPADPINEWRTEAFTPTLVNNNLYARGASDMKGQLMATIFAVEALLKTGGLPINVKFLLEGEEEIGSPSLDSFIHSHKELLACDIVLNPDAGMISKDMPTLTYGLRGMIYFELRIDGPQADLHSGLFGGVVANPANVLAEIIAKLHNPDGSIAIPGFYDEVLPLDEIERKKLASHKSADEGFLQVSGSPKLFGEAGYTSNERAGARPTLDVNGLYSGFIGEGAKTIIPAYAKAKISCRLVPDQDPEIIYMKAQRYIASLVPDTVRATFYKHSGSPAYLASDAPGSAQLVKALEETWRRPVTYRREGGSIPVATTMQNALGVKSLLTGFGLPDDQIHSPNEHQNMTVWKLGIQAFIRFLESYRA
ncbi:MAG TPA: dipeptidase [Anaerolineaceae bacterium]|nr:dipeptidase [Anaerolineaceae bacterium]